MDENEWLKATDPTPMLTFLREKGRPSDRKLRLFACACVRRIWQLLAEERSHKASKLQSGLRTAWRLMPNWTARIKRQLPSSVWLKWPFIQTPTPRTPRETPPVL